MDSACGLTKSNGFRRPFGHSLRLSSHMNQYVLKFDSNFYIFKYTASLQSDYLAFAVVSNVIHHWHNRCFCIRPKPNRCKRNKNTATFCNLPYHY